MKENDEKFDFFEFVERATVALTRLVKIGDVVIEYSKHNMSAEVAMANIEAIYSGKEDGNGED